MDGRRPTNDTIRHGQEYNRERVKNGVMIKKEGERESVSDDQREREERECVSGND
jgi:hypothetical protein